ncbi:MAG: hypothetical protein ACOYBJ_00720 [Patescibacteria group bacterium]|jgi:uncharacterized membrane protein
MLDLVTIALILHIIGAVLGVGGATYNDLLLVRAIGDRELGPAYQKNAAAFSLVIWTAIALLVATGLFFVVNDTSLLANQKFLTKLSLVVLLVVNGGLMNSLFQPPLERLRAIDWAERTPALCRLVRGALPFASISIVTWYTVLIFGAQARSRGRQHRFFLGTSALSW